jgi:hypothetical protein
MICGLFFGEHSNTHPLNRVGPAFRQVLKMKTGYNSILRVPGIGVIDIAA